MISDKLSRRDFLRLSALTAAGVTLAACGPKATEAPPEPEPAEPEPAEPEPAEPEPTEAPPAAEEILLEVASSNPEYSNAERQIWDLYEAENPNVKIEIFDVNEDTEAAFRAKLAGGYMPAIVTQYAAHPERINKGNYTMFVDLSTIDYPYWDRFTYDAEHAWPDTFNLPGPRSIQITAGFVFTWMFHTDLMEAAGLDPRSDVKTWSDLKDFLQAGTEWANANPDIDFFWDQGWHSWVFGVCYADLMPLAFPDGQRARQNECWTGELAWDAEDSPYRHFVEFFKDAYDNGWIPENWWTREWETDMEASYIAKKSVMMLHGPWPWDKMLAADPTAEQLGLPATPPAEGQATWMQNMGPINYDSGFVLLEGVQELPEWEEIKKAFIWWNSPDAVKMRAEALGQIAMMEFDEPLELSGPQWLGVVKDIATPGGLWEDVPYPSEAVGSMIVAGNRKAGSTGVWDWESGANVEDWTALMTEEITVQDFLGNCQARWEESYEGLPA
jgi:ABC-type glycerol-3-phosphate transport system substrate-binding protein